jgi:hypothetical protein
MEAGKTKSKTPNWLLSWILMLTQKKENECTNSFQENYRKQVQKMKQEASIH